MNGSLRTHSWWRPRVQREQYGQRYRAQFPSNVPVALPSGNCRLHPLGPLHRVVIERCSVKARDVDDILPIPSVALCPCYRCISPSKERIKITSDIYLNLIMTEQRYTLERYRDTNRRNAFTHMPIHKRCPFCDRMFEIGEADHEPIRRHIRISHSDERRDESPEMDSSIRFEA